MIVSVIVPCYNGEQFIEECLESLEVQDFRNFEVVFVDDCSTDDSLAVAKNVFGRGKILGLIVEIGTNGGESMAVNAGLNVASGDVAVVLSVDDKLAPSALSAISATLDAHPEAIGCFGNWTIFDDLESRLIDLGPKANIRRMVTDFDCLPSVGSAFRLNYKGVKPMRDPTWGPVADFEFWLNCASQGPLVYVSENVGFWRNNAKSQSNTGQCVIAQQKVALANRYQDRLIGGIKGGKRMLVAANLQAYYLSSQAACEKKSNYLKASLHVSFFASLSYLFRSFLIFPILKGWLTIGTKK